ncbi:hypothetical protein V6Z11_A05G404100 [Gossypium hirsutum]|uniref:Uncharacterized protein n=2 Tax=Gossypium TaxID=3633 RepID=A0A1U8PR27_GOSHI|nr:uncharacterized protein LOC107960974 [Gossypium hirsutum]PPS10508.1 hypothetical protein GOBAR_AA10137 [Gossypium barbadense]
MDARFVACGDPIELLIIFCVFCYPAMSIWMFLIRLDEVHEFLNSPFAEWLDVNITDPSRFPFDSNNWDCFFAALCWCIWKEQNRGIFDVDSVVGAVSYTKRADFGLIAGMHNLSSHLRLDGGCTRALTIVHWIKLNISWLKVNTEGARNEESECAVVDLIVLCRIMMVFG